MYEMDPLRGSLNTTGRYCRRGLSGMMQRSALVRYQPGTGSRGNNAEGMMHTGAWHTSFTDRGLRLAGRAEPASVGGGMCQAEAESISITITAKHTLRFEKLSISDCGPISHWHASSTSAHFRPSFTSSQPRPPPVTSARPSSPTHVRFERHINYPGPLSSRSSPTADARPFHNNAARFSVPRSSRQNA